MSLWISVALTTVAVLTAAPIAIHELTGRGTRSTRPRRTISLKLRVRALIVFLILIILAQFAVFLSATNRTHPTCLTAATSADRL
jgi:hypothetical protein